MFKKILSVVTIILVVIIGYTAFTSPVGNNCEKQTDTRTQAECYQMREKYGEGTTMWEVTIQAFKDINIWVLLLLIPEQIFMYYAAGQIYFSFLKKRQGLDVSQGLLTRISLEINFVNHALPSAGVSGLGYLIWRLKKFKITAGQVSFIHILRYIISALANTAQTWIAIIIVIVAGCVRSNGWWAVWLAALVALGIQLLIFAVWLIVRKQSTIDKFSAWASNLVNNIVTFFQRKRTTKYLKEEAVNKFFMDLRGDYLAIKANKKIMWRPVIWGTVYAFFELATYWVVAIALGHPEILPQIMIAEGVASVVGTLVVTPGGMGGYEGAMIAVLIALGVDFSTATITVVVTRVIVMLGTIVTGWGFYQQALLSRKDKFKA